MTLPITHPFSEAELTGASLDCSTGKAIVMRAPFRGQIRQIGTMLGSVLSTADATATASIAGVAITGAAWVITQSGSAIGDHDFANLDGSNTPNATITAANVCQENDLIKIALTGSGTAGGVLHGYAIIRPI